jgi:hypothetical protein
VVMTGKRTATIAWREPPALRDDATGCPETFDPVCGTDRNTYINECFAAKSKVEIAGLGACTPNGCPSIQEPVCGMNGRTFVNRCEAGVERVPVQRKGKTAPRFMRRSVAMTAQPMTMPVIPMRPVSTHLQRGHVMHAHARPCLFRYAGLTV